MTNFFITGTDTGVGKTRVTITIMAAQKNAGFDVVGMKPVASGAQMINGKLINDDAKLAKKVGAKVLGIIGRDGGYTGKVADACIIIPTQSPDTITPHAEAWQAVVWHMLVTDPRIMAMSNKWESIT